MTNQSVTIRGPIVGTSTPDGISTAGSIQGESITSTGDIIANNGTVHAGSIAVSGGVTASSMDIAGDVHITSDGGNVGIGTTTPGSKLDVVQANSAAIRALSGDANSHTSLSIGRTADEGRIGVAAFSGQFANDAVAGDIILQTETTTPHLLFGNGPGNSTMAIHNGNVGIGTTIPRSPLEVRGDITAGSISSTGDITANNGTVHGSSVTAGSISSTGNITADGEVIANNAKGNPTIVLNGGSALVEIGSANGAGVLDILDASGQLASEISGGLAQFGNGIKSFGTITVQNTDQNGYGIKSSGGNIGVYAHNSTAANGHDVGHDVYLGTQGLAGDFYGDIMVHGSISKPNSMFQIDHPLDPARKYLFHSSVESPDMKNMYDGVAMLDANGEAVVELPAWFEALNTDFRYQLTPIGAPGPNLYIAEEISNNHFRIAGGMPSMKVSWQVTGVRQDAWAKAHRIRVEEDKPAEEQGHYLHPELHGESEEKHVRLVRYPETV